MIGSFREKLSRIIDVLLDKKDEIVEQSHDDDIEEVLGKYVEAKQVALLLQILDGERGIDKIFQKMAEMKEEIEVDKLMIRESRTLQVESPTKKQFKVSKEESQKIDHMIEQLEEIDDQNEFLKESPVKQPVREIKEQTKGGHYKLPVPNHRLGKPAIRFKTDTSENRAISFTDQRIPTQQPVFSLQKLPQRCEQGVQSHHDDVFLIYQKQPLGILKENSFQQRSLFYKTINYEKIIQFLLDVAIKMTAEHRLQVIKTMRKFALNHKYITKEEFKEVYGQLCAVFQLGDGVIHGLIDSKKKVPTSVQKKLKNIVKGRKAIALPSYDHRIEKSYTSNAIDRIRTKQLTWQNLFNLNDASLVTGGQPLPFEFNRQYEQEDQIYLQQFHQKPKKLKNDMTKRLVLPMLKHRQS